jgi:hypothetical protein
MPTPKRDKRGRFVKQTGVRESENTGSKPISESQDFSEMLAESVTPERWQAIIERALAQAEAGNRDARAFLAKYLIREDAAPVPPKVEIVFVPPRKEGLRTED